MTLAQIGVVYFLHNKTHRTLAQVCVIHFLNFGLSSLLGLRFSMTYGL